MVAALAVAEGTRRSNMSRLRSWLGTSPDGEAYLPDAYTGRITLLPAVSSDWQRLQILTSTGVNRASDAGLQAALELVRGAPLADAAPGQWHWAEELRTDMISCVRDIGVELADRALLAGDLERARWAASRALVAAPGDELLLAVRIRTEHAAGNVPETERLTLQLAAQARTLGVDLDDETVIVAATGHGRTGAGPAGVGGYLGRRLRIGDPLTLDVGPLTSGNRRPTVGERVHPKHPKKEVNDALDYADQQGFEVERTVSGHRWGRITCTCGASVSIWSTPKSPHDHGRQVAPMGCTNTSTMPRRRGYE